MIINRLFYYIWYHSVIYIAVYSFLFLYNYFLSVFLYPVNREYDTKQLKKCADILQTS